MNGYATLDAAYKLTGVSEALILDAIRSGEIRARRCTGETVVVLSDVRDYRARLITERGCAGCRD